MTRNMLAFTLLLFLLAGACLQCHRNNGPSLPVLTGKLVIDNGCQYSAAVILTGQFDTSKVLATWTDPDNNVVYHNIFRISALRNACEIGEFSVIQGDTFQFSIDPTPQERNCYPCQTFTMPTLPYRYDGILNVKKLGGR